MKPATQKQLLRKLLLRNSQSSRLWMALGAVCIGTTLLLLSVMIWWNFREVLEGRRDNDSLGSTFLTINKKVTAENMGIPGATLFQDGEVDAMRGAPQVQDVGVLTSNRFPVYAMFQGTMSFATEMFLEGVPDRFIDKKPDDWYWQEGNTSVPIILSSEFLNLYNYGFALSQGLPQLSETTIKSLAFDLRVGIGESQETYIAHVVGFSDRINSVLVPESFIKFGNKVYGRDTIGAAPSRLIVRVKDPSNIEFTQFLQQRGYTTNAEQLRWNKLRSVVDAVSSGTGILALLLMSIGTLVFILFIELTIARARQSLILLREIGFGPRYLGRFMIRRFVPLIFLTLAISVIIVLSAQFAAAQWAKGLKLTLALVPGWPVWLALTISAGILFLLVSVSIVRAIRRDS